MTDIIVHMRRIESGLSSRLGVVDVIEPIGKRLPNNRAIFRTRILFYDGSYLDFKERVDSNRCYPSILSYSYQYIRDGHLVFRYDNARHHPEISSSPHHKHVGPEDNERIEASDEPSHNQLFIEIFRYIN